MHNKNPQKGFTILVAVVTAGILLIIAMSIGGIALKEQVLSIASKESQIAFYAADAGMECALYWDLKKGAFTRDIEAWMTLTNLKCNDTKIESLVYSSDGIIDTYTFKVPGILVGSLGATTCSIVRVTKDTITDPNQIRTVIDARGYNTCEPSLSRLERGIHYQNYRD